MSTRFKLDLIYSIFKNTTKFIRRQSILQIAMITVTIEIIFTKHEKRTISINESSTVFDLMRAVNINPEAFVPLKNGKLIPRTTPLENNDYIQFIPGFSGG